MIQRQIAHLLPGRSMTGILSYPREAPSQYWPLFGLAMINTYLKSNGLAQMDRLTMAHSVEGRTPLVDYKVAEYALSTMANRQSLEQPKAAIRNVASHILPKSVITRPKMGFTPPVREWIRRIWHAHQSSVRSPALAQIDAFDQENLLHILQTPIKRTGRVDQVALRLLTLELWMRGVN